MTVNELVDVVDPATTDPVVPDQLVADQGAPDTLVPAALDEFADPVRYDLEYGLPGADGVFYRSLADRTGGRVLDLATGTGRIALELARGGHDVTAVDVSEAMLGHAAGKPGAEDVTWVRQDVRELALRGRFDLVTLAGNAFQCFVSNDDRDAVLEGVWRQLQPGGVFAFSLRFPHPAELARRVDVPELWHTYLDAEGREVLVSGTRHFHPVAQVVHHETYRHFAVDGTPAAAPTSIALRYHFPQELETALRACRFEVVERYGDFDGAPLGEQASVMVYVCRKRPSTRRSA